MMQDITWDHVLFAQSCLIKVIRHKIQEQPERKKFWQNQLLVAMIEYQELFLLKTGETQEIRRKINIITERIVYSHDQ